MSEKEVSEKYSLSIFKSELEEALNKPKQSGIALYIAALAALLSIISLADKETDKVAMSAHIESANKFAWFQAKSIRYTDAKIAVKLFEKLEAPQEAAYWKKKALRYNNEKFDIFKVARAQEKIRHKALAKGDYYKVGVTLMQIAIVLASASLVLGGGVLFGISMILTVISVFYAVNGFGLFFEIPTNPGVVGDWILSHLQPGKSGAPGGVSSQN